MRSSKSNRISSDGSKSDQFFLGSSVQVVDYQAEATLMKVDSLPSDQVSRPDKDFHWEGYLGRNK